MPVEKNVAPNTLFFPAIDILRGFAAVTVLIYHAIHHLEWSSFPASGILSWFRVGWMGVDLFFVISGLVIGLAAFSGIDKYGQNKFRMNFATRRFVRIAPLHYLTILIFIAFITPGIMFDRFWPNLITHLLFIHNFDIGFHSGINGVNWTIATEMQFYLLILIFAPLFYSNKWWKTLVSLVLIAWIWRYFVALNFSNEETSDFRLFVIITQLPGMLDEFVMGIMLALFFKSKKGGEFIRAYANKPLALFLSFSLAIIGFYIMITLHWSTGGFWANKWTMTFFRTIMALSFACIVFAACLLTPKGILKTLLFPLTYLGTISYGIYLWHLPVLLSLRPFINWTSSIKLTLIAFTITFVLSSMSWHFFEQPLIQRMGRTQNK